MRVSIRPSVIDPQKLTPIESSELQVHVPALDAQVHRPKDPTSSQGLRLKDHLDKSLFFSFFNEMVDDLLPTLDSNEQVLYIQLFRLSYGFNRNYCTVSQSLLIERTGFSRNTVRTSLQSLAQKGWLRVVDAGNRVSTTYLVVLPRDKITRSQNSRVNSDPQNLTVIEKPSGNEGHNMSRKIRRSESTPPGDQNSDLQNLTLNSLILSARELVDEFYSRLGQRPSKIKREKSIEECLNLLLEGFTVEEVDYAITWLIQHHPTTGSFSRLSHFIDQAIKEWEAGQQTREVDQEEARAAEHQGAEQQRMEDERQQIEEAKGLLPPETLEGLYHEAKHLIEQESPGLKFGKDLMIRVNLNCDGDHGGAPVAIRVVMATTQHGHIPSDVSGQDPSAERKWHETKGCGCKA